MFQLIVYNLLMGKNELYSWSYGPLKSHKFICFQEKTEIWENFSTEYNFSGVNIELFLIIVIVNWKEDLHFGMSYVK